MTLQKRVKKELKEAHNMEPEISVEYPNQYYPLTIKFGDRYNPYSDSHDATEVAYLLSKFPPCEMFKHADSCTAYYPTDVPQKKKERVIEVNPIRLDCDGLDSYVYTLIWYTKIKENFFKIEVIINYGGSEYVKITYKYNDSRQLPKYSRFKAVTVMGLKAIMYYGDSGDYMAKFKCEVIDIHDKSFFIQ
jgi:hypothetical protein